MSSFEKISLWIIKIGLWALPVLPLYISGSMLFPFITGKNFAFRIATEFLFAVWAGLAVSRPEYRPRLTPLFKIVSAFVGIVFLADILSPHPYRSFFSNYERMEGFMMIAHMYIYFVMLTSVFTTRRDWMIFFHVSLAASVVASWYGLMQRLGVYKALQGGFRVDSTIGNPTYFAAYLLFHVWLLAVLIYEYGKAWWRTALYIAVLMFELAMIYFTATRGVVLALALAVPPILAVLVYFWDRIAAPIPTGWHTGRKIAAILLVLSLAVPLLFWSVRKQEFVQKNPALQRLTNYSFREGTIQDRFLIWKMSWKGIAERPILGWGQENYYLVFQKYYEPGLFGAEPWFDRSHNVFLDWAVHTGLSGLAAYLGILGIALWQIIGAMRRDRAVFFTGLMMVGLFATDFFQKLFVFDNFTSYFLFFAFLAYSEHMRRPAPAAAPVPASRARAVPAAAYGAMAMAVMLAVAAVWGWWAHVRPMRQARSLIRTLQLVRTNADVANVTASFNDTLSWNAFGTTEAREQLAQLARGIAGAAQGPADQRMAFTDYALAELRREVDRPAAADVKHLLYMLSIASAAVPLDQKYIAEGERIVGAVQAQSPTKQHVWLEIAQFYLVRNQVEPALAALERAWRLDERWILPAGHAWTMAVYAGKPAVIADIQRVWTLEDFDEAALANISRAYQQTGDFAGARDVYAVLVRKYPSSAQYHATYAALLANGGNPAEAARHAEEAIRLDPAFEKEARQFLRTIR